MKYYTFSLKLLSDMADKNDVFCYEMNINDYHKCLKAAIVKGLNEKYVSIFGVIVKIKKSGKQK